MRQNRRQSTETSGRYDVRSVKRALALLKAFSLDEPQRGLTELAMHLGLSTSTTFRLLSTLQSEGYVQQDQETGKYSLGLACWELGSLFLGSVRLREQAMPLLTSLRNECGETVHLGILDRDRMEVVYVEKLEGLRSINSVCVRPAWATKARNYEGFPGKCRCSTRLRRFAGRQSRLGEGSGVRASCARSG
jgi:hypothetical protein